VIHHSDCGMQLFTGEIIGDLLEDNLETAQFDGKAWSNPKHGGGSIAGHFVHWHTFADMRKASPRTCSASAAIRWCHQAFRSTASSMMSKPAS